MNVYDLDTLIELTGTFTTSAGAPINPTTVTLRLRTPDGIVTTYTGAQLGNPAVGVFTLDFQATQSGPHIYKWQGAGNVEITNPDAYFSVNPSAVLAG